MNALVFTVKKTCGNELTESFLKVGETEPSDPEVHPVWNREENELCVSLPTSNGLVNGGKRVRVCIIGIMHCYSEIFCIGMCSWERFLDLDLRM